MSIHPTAIIDDAATIHPSVKIGPRAVIEGPVEIGANTVIHPAAIILGKTQIGAECQIHSNTVIGDNPQDRAFDNDDSLCVIGDRAILREGVTVHRGTGDGTETRIGDDCFLMTNSHVGHNCTVGNHVTIVSGALLGGHVTVGDKAVISGNTAVHQFVRVGTLSMLAGVTAVTQDIPPFSMTDHLGRVAGINVVGLRRSGFSSAERAEITVSHDELPLQCGQARGAGRRRSAGPAEVVDALPGGAVETGGPSLVGSRDRDLHHEVRSVRGDVQVVLVEADAVSGVTRRDPLVVLGAEHRLHVRDQVGDPRVSDQMPKPEAHRGGHQ